MCEWTEESVCTHKMWDCIRAPTPTDQVKCNDNDDDDEQSMLRVSLQYIIRNELCHVSAQGAFRDGSQRSHAPDVARRTGRLLARRSWWIYRDRHPWHEYVSNGMHTSAMLLLTVFPMDILNYFNISFINRSALNQLTYYSWFVTLLPTNCAKISHSDVPSTVRICTQTHRRKHSQRYVWTFSCHEIEWVSFLHAFFTRRESNRNYSSYTPL